MRGFRMYGRAGVKFRKAAAEPAGTGTEGRRARLRADLQSRVRFLSLPEHRIAGRAYVPLGDGSPAAHSVGYLCAANVLGWGFRC